MVILFIYLLGGCFMDALAFMILTLPIFYPLAIGMGFNAIWFGIMITLVTEMGAITPPVGINVYIISGIAKEIPLETIFRGILPFLIPFIICIALLITFPEIALFLPSMIH
jgi:TRAP-type C4-dicarboxylate transport system permease large subunit